MKTPERSLEQPTESSVTHGAKIGFTELLKTNIAVIEQHLKTQRFKVDYFKVGTIAETEVAVCYVEGLVDNEILNEVRTRIKNIDVLYVPNKKIVTDAFQSGWAGDTFPTIRTNERVDVFVSDLMQGRVGVIVDNNPYGTTIPFLFWESFMGTDEYFAELGRFTARLFRFMSLLIGVLLPAIYIALVYHHPLITKHWSNVFAHKGAIPQIVQILILLITYRTLLAIIFNLPQSFVFFITVVSTNALGAVAIGTKMFDATALFVVSFAVIFGLDVFKRLLTFTQLRLPLIFVAYWFDFTGVIVVVTIITIYMAMLDSCGVPYLSPLIPFRMKELNDSLFGRGKLKDIVNEPHRYPKIK